MMTPDLLAFLSRDPLRCDLCGWHIRLQGHELYCKARTKTPPPRKRKR